MVPFSLRGISKGDQEKIMWNFQGPLFLALEFPRDLTQFCGISRIELCFVRNFKRSRKKKKNSRGFSKRHVINNPPPCLDFSGIAHSFIVYMERKEFTKYSVLQYIYHMTINHSKLCSLFDLLRHQKSIL